MILRFYIPPGSSDWAFISYMCFFMHELNLEQFVHPCTCPVAMARLPAHWNGPFLRLEQIMSETNHLSWNSPLSSVVSHGILASTALTGQSSLSSSPRLESCCLPSSLLSVSWAPPSHGHCRQQPKSSTSSSFLVRIRSNRTCPFINNTVIHVMNLSHQCTYLDFLWSALLAFQQILDTSGKFPTK